MICQNHLWSDLSKLSVKLICQDGFRTSTICSRACGCWILQSNGELTHHYRDDYHAAESNNDDADDNNDNGDDDGVKDKSDDDADTGDGDCESLKFKVEEGDTLYVDYEGTLEVTLLYLKFQQTTNILTKDS